MRLNKEFDIKSREIPTQLSNKWIKILIKRYLYGYKNVSDYIRNHGRIMVPIGGRKERND